MKVRKVERHKIIPIRFKDRIDIMNWRNELINLSFKTKINNLDFINHKKKYFNDNCCQFI